MLIRAAELARCVERARLVGRAWMRRACRWLRAITQGLRTVVQLQTVATVRSIWVIRVHDRIFPVEVAWPTVVARITVARIVKSFVRTRRFAKAVRQRRFKVQFLRPTKPCEFLMPLFMYLIILRLQRYLPLMILERLVCAAKTKILERC